jgi:hypothetical protein
MPDYYSDLGFGGDSPLWKKLKQRGIKLPGGSAGATERSSLYNYRDPIGAFSGLFDRYGGVQDLFDTTGKAYSDPIEQLLRMEGAGRARGASLRAKRSAMPGFGGLAALTAELSSASDLARGLGEARAAGVESSQRFRTGLLGDIMGYGFQGERGERGFEQERALRREQQAHERRMAKQQKKGGSISLGGFGFSW